MVPKPTDAFRSFLDNPFDDPDSGEADGGKIILRAPLPIPHGGFNPGHHGKLHLDSGFPQGSVAPRQPPGGQQVAPQGPNGRVPFQGTGVPLGSQPSGNIGKSITQGPAPTMRVSPSPASNGPRPGPRQVPGDPNLRQSPNAGRSITGGGVGGGGGAGQQRPGGNFLLVPLQNNNNNNNRQQQQTPRPENRQTTPQLSPNSGRSNVFRSNPGPEAPIRPTLRSGQGTARSPGGGFTPAVTKNRGLPTPTATAIPSDSNIRRVTTASTTTSFNTKNGVLRIPGHEPEAPADITVHHQDRSFNKNVVDEGIIVKDDSSSLTPEGATALILVGICIVFLVFISFVVFMKKLRRQHLEKKVVSDLDKEYKKSYSNNGYQPSNLAPAANFLSSFGGEGGGGKGGGGFLKSPMLFAPYADGNQIDAKKQKEILATFLSIDPAATSNKLGRVWFSCYYDYVEGLLCVHILHARYIQGPSPTNTKAGEVHVEASVLTPLNKILAADKTNSRKATMAPIFNETLTFTVGAEEVTQFVVRLVLYHDDADKNESRAVGSVVVPLHTIDLCSQSTIFRDLQ
ncbi:uncharacterized protein LOC143020941 [Oratosquilla oratoria]|uniref:uncharacterized protein LOC143020941 n=1 Tax=Oratosquilla oratoria TaxID=337810 RepID=UPI003F768924